MEFKKEVSLLVSTGISAGLLAVGLLVATPPTVNPMGCPSGKSCKGGDGSCGWFTDTSTGTVLCVCYINGGNGADCC